MPTAAASFEIELKYFDGEPVIREIERVSKPGRRVYSAGRRHAARRQRPRRRHRFHAEGRDGRPRLPATPNVGGEMHLHGCFNVTRWQQARYCSRLASPPMSKARRSPSKASKGRTVACRACMMSPSLTLDKGVAIRSTPRDDSPSARAPCGAPIALWSTTSFTGVTKGFERQARDHGRRLSSAAVRWQEPADLSARLHATTSTYRDPGQASRS